AGREGGREGGPWLRLRCALDGHGAQLSGNRESQGKACVGTVARRPHRPDNHHHTKGSTSSQEARFGPTPPDKRGSARLVRGMVQHQLSMWPSDVSELSALWAGVCDSALPLWCRSGALVMGGWRSSV
ncbi:hypothetical protein KC19_3G114000, partial [Ceratodon purpureus]